MEPIGTWQLGLLALLVAFGTSPVLLRLLRGRVLDYPNRRSSHERPTPRGGGIAIILAVALGLLVADLETTFISVALIAALAYALIGFWDDLADVPVGVRLLLQLGVALVSARWLISDGFEATLGLATGSLVLATIWIVGYTNAFNFMDGINGIAAAQMAISGLTWAAMGSVHQVSGLAVLGAITAGAALGFLPWNFPKAKFFMGDVGSYFSGAWLAVVVIIGMELGIGVIPMLSPLLIFGLDTSYTIARRLRRRENIFEAHRSHIYQRLVRGGWSHTQTTVFYTLAASSTSLGGILLLSDRRPVMGLGVALILLGVGVYLLSPSQVPEVAA